jgi:GT2 family glycosyltransferase
MSDALKLSVIVPLAAGEKTWAGLLSDLRALPSDCEVLLVGVESEPKAELDFWRSQFLAPIRWIQSSPGRAVQQNFGAISARGNYLWFVHADSKIPRPTIHRLVEHLKTEPQSVMHFDLQFLNDGPRLVRFNGVLANWRSQYLKMPFGDQGFCMSRKTFEKIGGFPENESYGEDHVLIWEARRKNIEIERLPAAVFTSARKYEKGGWGSVTKTHVWLTTKQAFSEGWKLLKHRLTE